MSVGHDEYWSGAQRANVDGCPGRRRESGIFSGNEVFWKTRWEPSIDGSNTPRTGTLVCYKETSANAAIDPADPPIWTGFWRDARFSPPADGGRPENALTGTASEVRRASRQFDHLCLKLMAECVSGGTLALRHSGQARLPLSAEYAGYESDEDDRQRVQACGSHTALDHYCGGVTVSLLSPLPLATTLRMALKRTT